MLKIKEKRDNKISREDCTRIGGKKTNNSRNTHRPTHDHTKQPRNEKHKQTKNGAGAQRNQNQPATNRSDASSEGPSLPINLSAKGER